MEDKQLHKAFFVTCQVLYATTTVFAGVALFGDSPLFALLSLAVGYITQSSMVTTAYVRNWDYNEKIDFSIFIIAYILTFYAFKSIIGHHYSELDLFAQISAVIAASLGFPLVIMTITSLITKWHIRQ